jgi:hypothetical protein
MKHRLSASVGDAGIEQAVSAVAALAPFLDPPCEVEVDDVPVGTTGWPSALLAAQKDGRADWPLVGGVRPLVSVNPRAQPPRVVLQLPDGFETLDEGIGWIERLPFQVCSVGWIHTPEWVDMDVEPFELGVGHVPHGWACAFRGAGHDRLVSRRWLDFGPWRVIRRPGDLTVVQFHDVAADPATAAQQALPGWERMGVSPTGGFLPSPYLVRTDVEGLYSAATRTLEIVVPPGGAVTQIQMRDACAMRVRHGVALADAKPVDQVAYVFLEPAGARAHLHEMWLRELEVWQVDQHGKRRIDLDYQPAPPAPPAWVAALDDG